MDNLAASNANADLFSTLNTIGKDVAYYGSSFNFTGEPVKIGYELDGQASQVTLSLQQNGVTLATLQGKELGPGSHYFTWDGLLSGDKKAPQGEYKIIIEAQAAAGESVGVAPLVKSEVTGVDLQGGYGGMLKTKAGEIAFHSILGVYEPGSSSAGANEEDSQQTAL